MHVLSFSATLTAAQYSVRLPVACSIVITGQKCTLSVIQRHIQASVLPMASGVLSV